MVESAIDNARRIERMRSFSSMLQNQDFGTVLNGTDRIAVAEFRRAKAFRTLLTRLARRSFRFPRLTVHPQFPKSGEWHPLSRDCFDSATPP